MVKAHRTYTLTAKGMEAASPAARAGRMRCCATPTCPVEIPATRTRCWYHARSPFAEDRP